MDALPNLEAFYSAILGEEGPEAQMRAHRSIAHQSTKNVRALREAIRASSKDMDNLASVTLAWFENVEKDLADLQGHIALAEEARQEALA